MLDTSSVDDRIAYWDAVPLLQKPSAEILCVGREELIPAVSDRLRERQSSASTISAQDETIDCNGVSAKSFSVPGYPLIREIGRGGQAIVYEAVKTSTGQRVAVKLSIGGHLASPDQLSRMHREARILALLDHPNIVPIIDRGVSTNGCDFIVMRLIKGETLDKWLQNRWKGAKRGDQNTDDPAQTLKLYMKICSAVESAHREKIVHRDLKPGNIIVDARGEPHILDFGLARQFLPGGGDGDIDQINLTVTNQFLGSLRYASPEQALGRSDQISPRTDVYALGVILYQILTDGQFPYPVVGNIHEILTNILHTLPQSPSKAIKPGASLPTGYGRLDPGRVNPGIEIIVLKALCKDPLGRYESAGKLEEAVRYYLAGLPDHATLSPKTDTATNLYSRGHRSRKKIFVALGTFVTLSVPLILVSNLFFSSTGRLTENPAPMVSKLERFEDSAGIQFVRLKPGRFAMGSPAAEEERGGDESLHDVELKRPIFIGCTEVTQGQWMRVMGQDMNPSQAIRGHDYPVENVSWDDAVAFCKMLGKLTGNIYRLPTESEWEYACRAGAGTAFNTGPTLNPEDASFNAEVVYGHSIKGPKPEHTSKVRSFKPNDWGIFDMHGNVSEWCSDWYGPYPESAVDPAGSPPAKYRVLRGGSWLHPSARARAAVRNYAPSEYKGSWLGFRVVMEPR